MLFGISARFEIRCKGTAFAWESLPQNTAKCAAKCGKMQDPINLPKLTPKSKIFGGPEKGDFSFVSFVSFVT